MRSVVRARPGLMELDDREAPRCAAAGEALLRIRRIGICGSDIHAYGGNQPYFSYPRVLGHELAGEIVEVGDSRDQALVGQNASVIPYLHCGECRPCRKGLTNCCQRMQVIGVHRDDHPPRRTRRGARDHAALVRPLPWRDQGHGPPRPVSLKPRSHP